MEHHPFQNISQKTMNMLQAKAKILNLFACQHFQLYALLYIEGNIK